MTGQDLNVEADGSKVSGGSDPTDEINTSQAAPGDLATAGVNNQHFDPGNFAVFTLVNGLDILGAGPSTTFQNVNDIDYDSYLNTDGAGFIISQLQGNPNLDPDLTVTVWEAGGGTAPEEGLAYIGAEGGNDGTSGAFEDDTAINVETVTVLDEMGGVVAIWVLGAPTPSTDEVANGASVDGIKVTISGNSIDVNDLPVLYSLNWNTGGDTFNRFRVSSDDRVFDIGKITVDQGLLQPQAIGADVIIHDDGPTAGITDTGVMVVHDESSGQQTGNPAIATVLTAGATNTDLSTIDADIGDSDTLTVNGVVVFTYDSGAGETDVSDVIDAINAAATAGDLPGILDASFVGGDLLVTAKSSSDITLAATSRWRLSTDGLVTTNADDPEDNNDDDQAGALPTALANVATQGTGVTGWAKSADPVVTSDGTDFGTDGPAVAPDDVVWSLDVPGPDTDSGFDDLLGNDILLNVEDVGGVDVVVGRVDGGLNDGDAAIAIIIDQDGHLSVAQYLPILHGDGTSMTNPK